MSLSGNGRILKVLLSAPCLFFAGVTLTIFIFLLYGALPILKLEGMRFITGTRWNEGGAFGAAPIIYGTVAVTLIAVVLSVPFGVGSAIIISELMPGNIRFAVKASLELLAGIPGVVYGLIGIISLTTFIKKGFGVIDGSSILAAGVILSVMILPLVTTLSDDAMRSVPERMRRQAFALGLNKAETIIHVVLPNAARGITGAILLGISRAMGETIAVMLVVGSVDRIPRPFYNILGTGQTITSKLGREAANSLGIGYHGSALSALGLLLFLMVLGVTIVGEVVFLPYRRRSEKR